jgi:UDP-N-acetyl-D-glucosamine dehydrogenase
MFKVAVIGQGYVGFPLAIHAAEAGNTVIGYDIDDSKVTDINGGKFIIPELDSNLINSLLRNGKYIPTNDPTLMATSDIIVIAVPTPLNNVGNPDIAMLITAAEIVAKNCKSDALVINESTSFPGTLRNLIKPIFDKNRFDNEIIFASAPERVDPGNLKWNIKNTPRIVCGLTEDATQKTIDFYQTFCDIVQETSSPEVAEASKLFENTFRMVNISLVNEFADISNKLGFSAHEAIAAAATKPFGFMAFYPGIGVGGHCIPIDPMYLSYSAKVVEAEPKLIDLAQSINKRMPRYTAEKIKTLMDNDLSNKRIQIAGISYKPNIPDIRESPAIELLKELRKLGAIVTWCDPLVKNFNTEISSSLSQDLDLGLVVTPHDQFDFSEWKNSGIKVFDLSANSINYGWPKFF